MYLKKKSNLLCIFVTFMTINMNATQMIPEVYWKCYAAILMINTS